MFSGDLVVVSLSWEQFTLFTHFFDVRILTTAEQLIDLPIAYFWGQGTQCLPYKAAYSIFGWQNLKVNNVLFCWAEFCILKPFINCSQLYWLWLTNKTHLSYDSLKYGQTRRLTLPNLLFFVLWLGNCSCRKWEQLWGSLCVVLLLPETAVLYVCLLPENSCFVYFVQSYTCLLWEV